MIPTNMENQPQRTVLHKTFAEFFAGIGLMRMGLELAGWIPAFANDIDPDKQDIVVPLNQALSGFDDAVCELVTTWIANNYINPLFEEIQIANEARNFEIRREYEIAK